MAMFTDQEDALIDYLEEQYGCHTLILYGSRAIGYATEKSDWDVLGLYEGGNQDWCHKQVEGVGEVNAYLYPASFVEYHPANPSMLYRPPEYFVRLRFGRVLIEEAGLGTTIVARAQQMFDKGPGPKPPNFDSNIRHQYDDYWLPKIADPTVNETERQFHRARMLHHSLDNYFRHREMWWGKSARDAFEYMKENDMLAYQAFEAALKPDAPPEAFRKLADYIMDSKYDR